MNETKINTEEAVEMVGPHTNHNSVILGWKTPDFIPIPKGKRWYLIAAIIMISLIAYAIYSGSATMAIVFILIAGMYIMTHKQKPKMVDVKITDLGVEYDGKMYMYHTINAFWIVYHPPYIRSLYLRIGGNNFKYVKIELNHMNPIDVRKLLLKEIPEIEGMEERFSDTLIRLLRLQ